MRRHEKSRAGQYTDLFIFPPLTIEKDWFGEEEIKKHLQGIVDTEDCPFETIIAYEEPKLYLFGKNNQFQKIEGEARVIEQCKIQADNYSGWSKLRKSC